MLGSINLRMSKSNDWYKWKGSHSNMYLSTGQGKEKMQYTQTLQDFQALHLEAAQQFLKRHYHYASYVLL
jgi:hypothetical protein